MISPGSMRAISAAMLATLGFADAELAGRDIDPGERKAVFVRRNARSRQRQQIVVAAGLEQRILGQGPGRYQPHDIAAHHALGAALARFGRVLELFAHGDAMPERDQPMQIFVRALDRNAAHRNVVAEMLAALGQHDAERAGGHFGILEKQLVEVAHPVEQKTIRIGGLDLDILLHHRGDAGGVIRRLAAAAFLRARLSRALAFRRSSGVLACCGVGRVHGGGR